MVAYMSRNLAAARLVITFVLLLHITYVSCCTTPRGQPGNCVTIRSCQPLLSMLQQRPLAPNDAEYLRKSQCGFDGSDPKVCCPTTRTPDPPSPDPNQGGNAISRNPQGITTNLLPKVNECGADNADKLVGGEITELDEFPWMVLIEYRKPNGRGFYCGGVLISKRYVLTAAHCLKGKDLPKTWELSSVRLGEYNTETAKDCVENGAGGQDCSDDPVDIPVEERIAHEKYNPLDSNQYHDIALLRLRRDVTFTDFIKPICLPTTMEDLGKDFVGNNLYVAGWGKTENRSESNIKLKLKIPVKGNAECTNTYRQARVDLGPGQLCAGGQKGKDSCRGDSGGPLMAVTVKPDGNSYWICAGIVSFGPSPCGMQGWPGVYTRVTEYTDWIVSKLRP